MKKHLTCLIAFIVFALNYSLAQTIKPCAIDETYNTNIKIKDPLYYQKIVNFESLIQKAIQQKQTQGNKTSSVVYTIPIVVHVIHLGEPVGVGTNISDFQIQQSVAGMNDRFRNLIGSGGVDVEIQFCLATTAPNGSSTTGINRVSGLSIAGYGTGGIDWSNSCPSSANEIALKSLSIWPNTSYYNIWIVSQVCSGQWGGYAYYPGAPSNVDGAVVVYNQANYNDNTFAHELGHGLNLYHTFEGDGGSANLHCPFQANGCGGGIGDCCGDTPIHKYTDCGSTNPCTGLGIWDNSRYNYMSYCFPQNSVGRFTSDQKSRMVPALTISRASLITSNGCGGSSQLNCAGAINLTCGQTYNSTTVGSNSNVSSYSCIGWNESGPEKVYVITTTSTGNLTATISNLNGIDLDVFILDACNPSNCVGTVNSNSATYTNAPAGTYYIIVEGYQGASGSYTLNVIGNCGCAAPFYDLCPNANTNLTVNATCNYINGNSCGATYSGVSSCSGANVSDVWYSFNSGNNSNVIVSVQGLTDYNPAFQVLGGTCGGGMTSLACFSSPFPGGLAQSSSISVTPFTNYYVRVWHQGGGYGTNGDFQICVTGACINSTDPNSAYLNQNYVCPGTPIVLSVNGGSLGTGANWIWYENGCANGSSVGTGSSITVYPNATTTYYVRAEGTCNNTNCVSVQAIVYELSIMPTSISASPNPVCSNNLTTLTIQGGYLGTNAQWYWSTGGCGSNIFNTSISNIYPAYPSNTITYYAQAVGLCNSTNCVSTTVTVCTPSIQASGINASQTAICQGNSTTLSVLGGSLGSCSNWYWYSGSCGGTPVGTGSSIPVSPSTTTTYYVRAEDAGVCPNTSCVSTTINVNTPSVAANSIIASQNTICQGNSVTLSVSGGSLGTGASWHWYSGSCGGTSVGTGASIPVSPSSTTTYYVRAEDGTGVCPSTSCVSTTITVNTPSVAASGINATQNPLCQGSSVTLSVSGGSLGTGASWHWYSGSCGGTSVGTGASIPVSPSSTTTYYVRAEDASGICASTVCVSNTITVNLYPDTSVTVNVLNLISNANGASYQWLDCNNGNSIIPGATNQTYTATQNGSYAVQVSLNGCTDTSSCYLIVGVGISQINSGGNIFLYPNPTNGLLNIKMNGLLNEKCKIVLSNTLGQILNEKEFATTNNSIETQFDMKDLSSGIYFLGITSNKIKQTFKVQKQ